MKFFKNLNIERFLFLFKGPISFKKAGFFSILLHGLLFLFMAFLMNTYDLPDLHERFLIFDLASVPTNVSSSKAQENKIQPPKPEQLHTKRVNHVEDNKMQPTTVNENEDFSVELSKTIFNSSFIPISLNLPRMKISKPKLLPAKISISQRQQEFLLREAKRLSEKLHEMNWSDSLFVWEDKKHIYEIKLYRKPANTITGLDEVVFEVTTQEDGHTYSTELRMRQLAFSNFAQFVDYWDPKVAIHDDEFRGRFHSNYTFTISQRKGVIPKFRGRVTTASYEVKLENRALIFDQQSVFIGGIERGVKEIRLPKTLFPFSRDTAVDSNQVHIFNEDTWITFHRDGLYSWKTESSPGFEHQRILPPGCSFFIVGDKKANLHVNGIVKGKVLVYSASNIIIDNDLFYARHPEVSIHADDLLGLVSQKDVEIAHPSVTGPGDLQIYAAIYAKGQFRVSHLQEPGNATLYIYGSLSAGTITATEPRYATRIVFDQRLENNRPPNFPMTDHYEMIEWNKQWEIKKP